MPKRERSPELKRLEKTVGNKIKEILKEKDLYIKDLWANAWDHYRQPAVSKRLNGDESITILDLKKAADYLDVSTDYLLGLSDDKYNSRNKKDDPITPKKFCEILLNLLNSSFPWDLKKITCKENSEQTIHKLNNENEIIDTNILESENEYYALYFSYEPDYTKHPEYNGKGLQFENKNYNGNENETVLERYNFSIDANDINRFIKQFYDIRTSYIEHSLSKTIYDLAIKGIVADVFDNKGPEDINAILIKELNK